jgi:pyocin large subunit-like protein
MGCCLARGFVVLLLIGKAISAIAAESETNHQSLFNYYKVPTGQARAVRGRERGCCRARGFVVLLLIGKASSAISAESETNHQSLFYYYKISTGQAKAEGGKGGAALLEVLLCCC